MIKQVLTVAVASSLVGCTALRDEVRTGGGAVGGMADRSGYYPAGGRPQLQVYRAIVSVAFMAKIGEVAIADTQSADAFANQLTATVRDINNLAGHVFPDDQNRRACQRIVAVEGAVREDGVRGDDGRCLNYAHLFETDLPRFEEHLFRLTLNALPRGEGSEFVDDVRSANVLSAAFRLMRVAGRYVWAGHSAAAVRRAERQILADIVYHNNGWDPLPNPPPHTRVDLAYNALHGDGALPPAYLDRIEGNLSRNSFEPLFLLIRDACHRLTKANEEDVRSDPALGGNPTQAEVAAELAKRRAAREQQCDDLIFQPNVVGRYARVAQEQVRDPEQPGGAEAETESAVATDRRVKPQH